MNYLVIDTENSGAQRNKAHPFDPRNSLLLLGTLTPTEVAIYDIEYSGRPYSDALAGVADQIRAADIIVGFNFKYDTHWLRRYGIQIPREKALWDCQLAEFILSRQTKSYPSLEDACALHGVNLKSSTLAHYLDMGADVPDIPLPELTEYLAGDLTSTKELFLKQIPLIEDGGYGPLFDLHMEDQRVLAEMEWNGLKYDIEKSTVLGAEALQRENEIIDRLNNLVDPGPLSSINWNSPDQLSAVLYGGSIKYVDKEEIGTYKTGRKAGLPKFRNVLRDFRFPRLVVPREKDKLAKEGVWSTSEDTLKDLQADGTAKEIIEFILEQARINKLRTSYYEGIPRRFQEKGWEDEIMHGQINQCVAITGRTSSSDPNLQNNPPESKECIVSRYAD